MKTPSAWQFFSPLERKSRACKIAICAQTRSVFLGVVLCVIATLLNTYAYAQELEDAQKLEDAQELEYTPELKDTQSLEAQSGQLANDTQEFQLTAAETDWQPASQVPEGQGSRLNEACKGAYLDPYFGMPEPDPAQTLIRIEAGTADMQDTQIILGDDVIVEQGPRYLRATHMVFDKITEQAELSGNVQIRKTGSLIHGQSAKVNMTGNEAQFTDGSFLSHADHMRGQAERIAHEADGRLVMEHGAFTSCGPNDPAWILEGDQLVLDPNKRQGSGKNIVVRVAGIPVLYTPYIRFPLGGERQSGLLTPSVGTVDGGVDLALPWYWNIAPHRDATITPRFVAGRGAMLETEYRHNTYHSRNITQAVLLPDDKGGNDKDIDELIASGEYDEAALRPHKGTNRWLLQLQHEGGKQKPWYSEVDFSRASDTDFLRDFPAASFATTSEPYLTQNARLGYDLANWHIYASLYNAQNLLADIDDAYRRLPQVVADGNYRIGDYGARFQQEYVRFEHRQDQRLNGRTLLTGERLRADYRFSYEKNTTWSFLKPSVGLQGMAYKLDPDDLADNKDDAPMLSTHYAILDSGLLFEHASGLQTIEPRLFYFFRQYTDHDKLFSVTPDGQNVNFDTSPLTFGFHQLFRPTRFAGGDRLDDANQLTVGLTHRLKAPNGDPIWDLSFGQTLYFANRRIGLTRDEETSDKSDIAGQFTGYISDTIRLLGSGQYNTDDSKIMRANLGIHYAKSQWRFNLDYRYARAQITLPGQASQKIDQIDFSFYLPTNDQWRLMGRSFYDLDEGRELETFIGFEYGDCCYRIRAVARRWLDSQLAETVQSINEPYDQGIFFEVELFGLGSSGRRIQSLLQESIFGFQDESF